MVGGVRRLRGARVGLVLVAGIVGSTLLAVAPASAAVGAGVSLTVPTGASVGATNLPASLTVTNTNTAPNQAEGNTLIEIRLAPSCAAMGTAANPCPTPDPGTFSISPTAAGASGTACAGRTFNVTGPDASGVFTFTVSGAAVVVAPPGGAAGSDRCTINFTMNVVKVPQIDVSASPGVQTWVTLRVRATSASGLMPVPFVSQMVTVGRGVLDLATQASPSVAVGGAITDTATLTKTPGTVAPTGTVTFSLYGPSDTTCSAPPVGQSTNGVGANGTATSSAFPVNQAGVYRFVAVYNGDANYISRTSPCGAVGESVTVTGRPSRAVADYNGDGRTDIAMYRPSTGHWLVRGIADTAWGVTSDIPVPGDYNGDGRTDFAIYRPSTSQWFVYGMPVVTFGASGDIPVPGDYNGDGRTDIAMYRPSTGHWLVRGIADTAWGVASDVPLPLPYAIRRTLVMP